MSARVLTLALTLAVAASPVRGDNPTAPAPQDVQDLVFLTEKRPVFIRLHIQVDGKSYEAAWIAAMHRLHKFMDLDGDGRLSNAERTRGSMLQQLMTRAETAAAVRRMAGAASPAMPASADQVETADQLAEFLR